LPEENEHCAILAADALHEAAKKYLSKQASKNTAAFLEKEEGLKQ